LLHLFLALHDHESYFFFQNLRHLFVSLGVLGIEFVSFKEIPVVTKDLTCVNGTGCNLKFLP
jgi:hypothetical protein